MNTVFYALSVAWKEIQLIAKDRGSLALIFLLPLLIGSLTGGINAQLWGDEDDAAILVDISLVNDDEGLFGERIADTLQEIDELEVRLVDTVGEAEDLVNGGDVVAAVVIPSRFTDDINAYTPVEIEVVVDPAQPQSAGIVTGIMNQVVAEVTVWGEVQYGVRTILEQSGALEGASPAVQQATGAQIMGVIMTRLNEMRQDPAIVVTSEDLEGTTVEGGILSFMAYLFPGFTVMFMFFIVGMAAESLLEERESGTLRRLAAAPLPRGAVVAGKMVAYLLLVCLQVAVLFAIAHFAFDMPLGSSPLGLIALTIVTGFVATALGMLVAAIATTAKQAGNIGTILGLVLAGIGGSMPMTGKPLTRAGGALGTIAKLTPHAHAIEGYYSLMAEDATLIQILPEIGILLGMGVFLFAIATWGFKFE